MTQDLISLLGEAFGYDAELMSEERLPNDEVQLNWRLLHEGSNRQLKLPPPLLVDSSGSLRWQPDAPEYPTRSFTRADLAEANPSLEANRHPSTIELGSVLQGLVEPLGLCSESGAVALLVALDGAFKIWPLSAAAIVSAAIGTEFWGLSRHAYLVWRYKQQGTGLALPRPYSDEEHGAAERAVRSTAFAACLNEHGRRLGNGDLFVPLIENERVGLYRFPSEVAP